jgi:hypothetical protein
MPGRKSVTGTFVVTWEAIVPTGGTVPEDKRIQAEEKKEKPFKFKKEKKRIQAEEEKEEEPWSNFHSMKPPPSQGRSSRTSRSFQANLPGDALPSPGLQVVVNCLTSISDQMLRMSGRSDKNGGWPWFNGTYKNYPVFWRKWRSDEKHHHWLTPQEELVQLFRENCMREEIAHRIRKKETMTEAWAWARLDILYNDRLLFIRDLMQEI